MTLVTCDNANVDILRGQELFTLFPLSKCVPCTFPKEKKEVRSTQSRDLKQMLQTVYPQY